MSAAASELTVTNLREVKIVIGTRSYRMQTALDESTLARVTNILDDVEQVVKEGLGQEHFNQEDLLMLTCLQLAYSLEKISRNLEPLENKLEDLDPWVPSDTGKQI
ncbi:MAG: cell division protein ZapA [Synergistaceae bacterium]|jgi:cell division protein ZapA (FtsZ GTPase activity inhibitor)|nr:cell division protein ZapA [Synergistaceae bacterium]